ncbi:MAG TPA: EAL domain-containing protein [Steroidobacteraceae bacterium]|nr:EAL domain-containing protein [Steroidobacteraceae bacterium]
MHEAPPSRGLGRFIEPLFQRLKKSRSSPGSARFSWSAKPSIRAALGIAFLVVFCALAIGMRLAHHSTDEAAHLIGSVERQFEPALHKTHELQESLTLYGQTVIALAHAPSKDQSAELADAGTNVLSVYDDYAKLATAIPVIPKSNLRARLESFRIQGLTIAELCTQREAYTHSSQAALNTLMARASLAARGFENGDQVYTSKSLSDLARSAAALRNATLMYFASPSDSTRVAATETEVNFRALIRWHEPEFSRAPGQAWFELMVNDLATTSRARARYGALEQTVDSSLAKFEQSAQQLNGEIESELQRPAWLALSEAAGHARIAAEQTETHITRVMLGILGLLAAMAVVILLGVAAPIRRLLESTRRLARGALDARVPRGGVRELDELAIAFNDMAEALNGSQCALREHQAVLEERIAQRTEDLRHLAHHDPLTELPNRRELAIRLDATIARAQQEATSCAVLYLDIDNFKTINDTLGHEFGDRVLRAFAARLLAIAGKIGFVARLGGDEFTLVVNTVKSAHSIEHFTAHVLREFAAPLHVQDRELLVSLSAGIALYPEHGDSVETLLRAADSALHDAKDKGRNGFQMYRAELLAGASHRFHTEQALRHAQVNGDFLLHFQPEVSLLTKKTTVVEALLRWRRPDGRIVGADEFIQIAEQSGLLLELSDWLLHSALDAARDLRDCGWPSARVAINVSAQQFLAGQFVGRVQNALKNCQMPADSLEVELTESALQTGPRAIETLQALRQMGIAVALDDFGTGYSTLKSIEELPLTRVKLDRSLIKDIEENPSAAAFAISCVRLCQSRGLTVTVEGVERAAQLDVLENCGDIQLQGYLIGRPARLEEIVPLVLDMPAHMAEVWPAGAAAPSDEELLAERSGVTFLRHRAR